MFPEPPTQEAYKAATAAHVSFAPPIDSTKIGYAAIVPIANVTEHPKKIAIILGPNLPSLRKSQRRSITKIIAYRRLFLKEE